MTRMIYKNNPTLKNKERDRQAYTLYNDSYKNLPWRDRRNVRKSIKNMKTEILNAESQSGLVQ